VLCSSWLACLLQAHCVCVEGMKKELAEAKDMIAGMKKDHRKMQHNLFHVTRDTFKPGQALQAQQPGSIRAVVAAF
jgi:hypothetical protein